MSEVAELCPFATVLQVDIPLLLDKTQLKCINN